MNSLEKTRRLAAFVDLQVLVSHRRFVTLYPAALLNYFERLCNVVSFFFTPQHAASIETPLPIINPDGAAFFISFL